MRSSKRSTSCATEKSESTSVCQNCYQIVNFDVGCDERNAVSFDIGATMQSGKVVILPAFLIVLSTFLSLFGVAVNVSPEAFKVSDIVVLYCTQNKVHR